uniref:Arrestin domain-containing protein 2-like n=1 Tax=Crassostrea virginica TaxID=6565 RepID=A0A8B8DNP9_CRAVI|nr:arrestin domain-containing protein 2-like [Crassostrea virginica]XP_022329205.1 arrestin domain-containing protein 2-like [Crassostrea virginica]
MDKIRTFTIELRNPQGVYYPRQVVRGEVILELDAPAKVREIRISFRGEAYVDWPSSTSPGDKTSGPKKGGFRLPTDDHYSACEEYFNRTIPLFGKGRGEGEINYLPVGRHSYPFDFGLPDALPSSFEGPWGYVRYFINTTIDRPGSDNLNYKRPFTLISPLDLNTQRNVLHSTSNRGSRRMCCLCCKSGPLSGSIRLDRIGFVPGEEININAEIQNLSSFDCDVWAVLEMKTIYFSTSRKTQTIASGIKHQLRRRATEEKISEVVVFPPGNTARRKTLKTRKLRKEIAKITHPGVDGGTSVIWRDSILTIPPVPPSFLEGCKIIDIRYFLKLVIETLGPSSNLEIPIEIIIGTVPIRPQIVLQNVLNPSVTPTTPPTTPITTPLSVPSLDTCSFDQPPSYSESVLGENDITDEGDDEHTTGQLKFAPFYTFYSRSPTTTRTDCTESLDGTTKTATTTTRTDRTESLDGTT